MYVKKLDDVMRLKEDPCSLRVPGVFTLRYKILNSKYSLPLLMGLHV